MILCPFNGESIRKFVYENNLLVHGEQLIKFVAILKPDVCLIAASKLQFRGNFWTLYILGMNFSSFQAMEPKNEPT